MTASEELDGAEEEASAPDGPLRLAVLGISEPGPCGMRDHGRILTAELEREGISCEVHWLERTDTTLTGALREAREWAGALPPRIAGADAVLLHYSWAAAAYRGLPLLEPLLARLLRRTALPVVAIMHELVFPFGRNGARGTAWALGSRAALAEIAAASDAFLVTTEDRRDWLAGRRWLARRPVAFAPVFSNLPAANRSGGRDRADDSPCSGCSGSCTTARPRSCCAPCVSSARGRSLLGCCWRARPARTHAQAAPGSPPRGSLGWTGC